MTWNWQQTDWPDFTWDRTRLARAEEKFLLEGGALLGATRYLESGERDQLTVDSLAGEALTTSEIEGEILDRDSVQSSIRRQFGLASDRRRIAPAEQGIAEMMVDLYRTFDEPLTEDTLFAWHGMIANGRRDLKVVAGYRTHEEAMQVVSGPVHALKVHFEAPPSAGMQEEMARFLNCSNAPSQREGTPCRP